MVADTLRPDSARLCALSCFHSPALSPAARAHLLALSAARSNSSLLLESKLQPYSMTSFKFSSSEIIQLPPFQERKKMDPFHILPSTFQKRGPALNWSPTMPPT